MKILIQNKIIQLQQIQHGKIWIGTNFYKSLETVSEIEAFEKVDRNFHSIAEIIAHLTIWRKETILKIISSEGSISNENGGDWIDNSKLKSQGWNNIKTNYENSLTEITELLESKNDDFLAEIYYDTDYKDHYPYEFLINGMIHHDLYHLGQINLILKLLNC